jgi:D-alanine-D-alanine ligase
MSKIIVIYGGPSSEREVSISSKNSVCAELAKMSVDYEELELSDNIASDLANHENPIVFNATHGEFGEDGKLQKILDGLQIPYTHSCAKASEIAMDKLLSKKMASDLGIKTADYEVLKDINLSEKAQQLMKKPFVIKPVIGGSSLGVHVILEPQNFQLTNAHFKLGDLILEEYIKGRELNVAIVNNKAIGTVEVVPEGVFYDYAAKYKTGKTQYLLNPSFSENVTKQLMQGAEKFHNHLGCNYINRVEFLVRGEDAFFLEANTQPGFTSSSLVPKVAASKGISFAEIIKGLLKNANYKKL